MQFTMLPPRFGFKLLFSSITRGSSGCENISLLAVFSRTMASYKLAEIGRFEPPRPAAQCYQAGQLFLHKIFGYRGVVLFAWNAKVYDRDSAPNKKDSTTPLSPSVPSSTTPTAAASGKSASFNPNKEIQGVTHTYYQCLIDERDWPYLRTQTESVTFLGSQDASRSLYAIPGLDYVGHEDILPYVAGDKQPIKHELFDKFLKREEEKDPPFCATDTLRAWIVRNQPWLELSDVHRETTENIRVTVMPFFMGCRESSNSSVYWWRYCIRLENMGGEKCILRERHWRIFSLSGTLETVRGRGVVGQEPVLDSLLPAFQYSSHVSLQAPSGHMWGTFKMERENRETFECRIPPFTLESKHEGHNGGDGSAPGSTQGAGPYRGQEPVLDV